MVAPHAARVRDGAPPRRYVRRPRAAHGNALGIWAGAMNLSDSTLDHLREVVDLPDLTGTRYSIEGEVGRGGLGVVYSALDSQLGRRVAIKVLDSGDEARVIANLEHPAIVPVYEAGTLPDGRAFYAMKLIDGTRLDRYLGEHRSLSDWLRVIERIGEALAVAHNRGVVPRGSKPENVHIRSF